jgi:hypothetical protein
MEHLMTIDLINGSFEVIGAILQIRNIRILLKDREVKGTSWHITGFFLIWGIWNLWYYPALGQWISLAGGLALSTMNLIWVILAIWFARQTRLAAHMRAMIVTRLRKNKIRASAHP